MEDPRHLPADEARSCQEKAAKYLRAAADGRDLVAEERATEEQEQASARRTVAALGAEWIASLQGKVAGDTCYLTPRVREAIRRLPRRIGNPYVFHGEGADGRRWGLQSAWRIAKDVADLNEISPDLAGFHLHDLRHHRISEMLAAGVAPQLVARQVGHTSLDQLRVYSHLEVADVAAVLGRLKPVEPAPTGELLEFKPRTRRAASR